MTLGLKFILCLNGKLFDFKKPSDIMDFQLQQIYFCEIFLSQGWIQAEITAHTL